MDERALRAEEREYIYERVHLHWIRGQKGRGVIQGFLGVHMLQG